MNTKRLCPLLTIPLLVLTCAINMARAEETAVNPMPRKTQALHLAARHGAPVEVQHTFSSNPAAGKPLDIQFTFILEADLETIIVRFAGEKGLNVDPASSQFTYTGYGTGQRITQTLRVIPPSDGVFYVNVFVSSSTHGSQRTKTTSVPIVVGKADRKSSLRANGNVIRDQEGQPFAVMQANETIIEEKNGAK